MSKTYLPHFIVKELEEAHADWRIENGSRHSKLFVNGVFCGVAPRTKTETDGRGALNLRSQVRRVLGR